MKIATCLLVPALCAGLWSGNAQAEDVKEAVLGMAKEVREWLRDDRVISAVQEQNKRHESLSQKQIDELDKQWRAETAAASQPLINKVLSSDLSKYLGDLKQQASGKYSEIFVMDNKGLNVGQSDMTSDYWQGDEPKWQNTFLKGADAVDVGEVELDESTQTYQSQLSLPVVDKDGNAIGAVTVGINLDEI